MIRRLLLWTLLAIVPLTNVRMICFDHAGGAGASVSPSGGECDGMCPREQPSEPEGGCLLVAGGCSAMMAFVVAVPPPAVALAAPASSLVSAVEPRDLYLPPVLGTFSPPPEA